MTELFAQNAATLNIVWNGEQGELPDPIEYDLADQDIRAMAQEVIQTTGTPGIDMDPNADFTDFVVSRYPAKDEKPNRVFLRPKVPFGA